MDCRDGDRDRKIFVGIGMGMKLWGHGGKIHGNGVGMDKNSQE